MEECFYDSPPPNRRLHEGETKEYLPLQAGKLKKNMRDRLEFTMRSDINRSDQQKKDEREKARIGIGFETVAGMEGGGYHRRNTRREAQDIQGLGKNCTSRESIISPLSRLIRGFRNNYH